MRYRNTTLAAATLLVLSMSSCAVPSGTGETSGTPAAWVSYTTPDGSLVFEHRADWTVQEKPPLANDPAGGISVQVNDAEGDMVARLDTGIITDLVCADPDEQAAYAEYDTEPMPELDSEQGTEQRFVYRSVAPSSPERGEAVATYAVISELGDRGQCGLFDFFTFTESSGGRFAGSYPSDAVGAGQSYLEGAAAYETSDEFRDVKRMLVSLRDTR
ncbi:hypothetical protein QNO00_13005 [Arthrobacter sp. zg-Y1219]|uniref:hypothetical protein n=1 Tax=Arthrobacter sp. zg-Y1219 TaxID=3049067 RepID=UPI0024C3EC42|nr:hypothetical protein [Arthrobacter sp. zg-Y1219]MDK1361178.1 hypothetical protein [Arthrobacter sp. zg-Y1219]